MFFILFKEIMCRNFLFVCSAYFGRHMRMLSIRLRIVHVHWAYAYDFYANAQHTHTIRTCMLSICVWSIWFQCAFSYAYAEHTHKIRNRMLSVCVQIVCVCSAYEYFRKYWIDRSKKKGWWNLFPYGISYPYCIECCQKIWVKNFMLFLVHDVTKNLLAESFQIFKCNFFLTICA